MDIRPTLFARSTAGVSLCLLVASLFSLVATPNSATAGSPDAEATTDEESEVSGNRTATTEDGDEAADADGSAFARRAPGDMTFLAGIPWGEAQSIPDARAHVSGLFTGLNYHLGRNGALTARLEWLQKVKLGDIEERYLMDVSAMLQIAFGIWMQFPVGASMFGLGLSLTGTSYLDRPPIPLPGAALTASYEYRFSKDMILGLSVRQAAPFPVHQRIGLFFAYDF